MLDKPASSYGAGFRSLTAETPAPVALPVTGALPSWLKGTLLRTGPSKFEVGARTYNHWFDGLAMLHRFALAGGGVTYANRFLDSKAFRAAQETGKIAYGEFATDPCRTLFGRVAAIFNPKLTDNCCVNVSDYAREIVAFTETSIPVRFAPETLKTLGVFGYRRALKGQVSTAHPHYDAKRACHYNYIVDFGLKSVYRLCRIGDDGRQKLVAALSVERPAYMHSFGMSQDHLVLTEFPLVVNPIDLRLSGKPFIQNYRWEPERGLVFHIVEKDTGRLVRTATAEATFAFHHVNAFADHDRLAVDVITYPDATIIDQLYLARLRASTPLTATGTLTRFHIPFAEGEPVTRRILADIPIELPRINYERHAGKPYRYVWGTGVHTEGDFLDSIVKIDTETGTVARWHAAGLYQGEPVFVPAPSASTEDDGVLLSIVLDIGKEHSFLLVLDAASLAEVARAAAPHAIPFHFHGSFFPA
ncbi:MAG TPA: carotenoid oxygenase family protein [Methyloceanibacter sp.]|jgi:carotenoid cleavage dioxygenase-like enzyme|nr:carotenoid oxygenase family protein [Methyloceanibacter sp.]